MTDRSTTDGSTSLPGTLRAAIAVLVLYAVFVIANATFWQSLGGWADWSDYPRGVLRTVMTGVLAWGLARREKWAWWIAVLLTGFWAIGGTVGVIIMFRVAAGDELPPTSVLLTLAIGGALLIAAFVLLLLRPSRSAILRRAA